MISYIVIGICIILLLLVVYISAKPISMGIEARRNINVDSSNDDSHYDVEVSDKKDDNNLYPCKRFPIPNMTLCSVKYLVNGR